uniref:Uncharacterized protein n=1 Tax=Megaselia scalaris TaxID=36166 RepID=T1GGU9_MEGSC
MVRKNIRKKGRKKSPVMRRKTSSTTRLKERSTPSPHESFAHLAILTRIFGKLSGLRGTISVKKLKTEMAIPDYIRKTEMIKVEVEVEEDFEEMRKKGYLACLNECFGERDITVYAVKPSFEK